MGRKVLSPDYDVVLPRLAFLLIVVFVPITLVLFFRLQITDYRI